MSKRSGKSYRIIMSLEVIDNDDPSFSIVEQLTILSVHSTAKAAKERFRKVKGRLKYTHHIISGEEAK